jgi:ferritin
MKAVVGEEALTADWIPYLDFLKDFIEDTIEDEDAKKEIIELNYDEIHYKGMCG